MKVIRRVIILLFATVTVACGEGNKLNLSDFTQIIYKPEYANGFEVRETKKLGADGTLITVKNPWQGATDIEQHLLLVDEGQEIPQDFEGQVARRPIKKTICLSSSYVAMFDRLGETDRVAGVSGIDYIMNPRIQERRKTGQTQDVGFDANMNFELIAAMNPDLVLLFGVTGENSVLTGKLRELNIPYIYIGEYIEQSPLGKAEWMMIPAELCDKREEGRQIFGEIADRYNTLKEQIANSATKKKPRVMLNTPYRDTWYLPPKDSYMVRLVEDAGGEYVYPQNTSTYSQNVDVEEAYLLAMGADVWINTGTWSRIADLREQAPKFTEVPAVKHNRVWNNNLRQTPCGGSDFWESGVMNPDRVLRDLHMLLNDAPDGTYTYYHKLQ